MLKYVKLKSIDKKIMSKKEISHVKIEKIRRKMKIFISKIGARPT